MVDNTVFYKRLSDQLKSKGKSFNQAERELGYPRNSLNNYKAKSSKPSGERLLKIANYLEVSPLYLLGVENIEDDAETETLEARFYHLDFEQKRKLYEICQSWATTELSKRDRK